MLRKTLLACLLLYATSVLGASPPPVSAPHAMVVSSQRLATQVGVKILKQGGNAIDAAVAVGYTLAVTHPCCGNIGGGGFMLIHQANGKNSFLNFRETAPHALKASLFFNADGSINRQRSENSFLASGVPGTVMGLNTALKEYGTMTLTQVMQPAIHYARDGYILSAGDVAIFKEGDKYIKQHANSAKIFFHDGKPYHTGERLKQPELAKTLTMIEKGGTQAFYHGTFAKRFIAAMKKRGGVMTIHDLATYKVEEHAPIVCQYRGYRVVSAPPPSSGGITLCEILKITEAYPLGFLGFHSAQGSHYTLEAMRYAYADRNQYLGDPNFVNNPTQKLLSPQYIQSIRNQIQTFHAGESQTIGLGAPRDPLENTTHYSIVDRFGNAVAITYTINGYFGNKLIAGDTGFFMNSEMDDFALRPGVPNQFKLVQGKTNAIAPGKRPLSSMTPAFVFKGDQLYMVLGAPGGSTIITQVLATIQNVIDYHMTIQEAIDAPRFHMQWLPDRVYMEPFAFSKDTQEKLATMGYLFQLGAPYGQRTWGAMAAILRAPQTGILYGAMDSRRPAGLAAGM